MASFDAGYFDVQQSITIAKLADELDRSQQAVSEPLRRAIANFLRTTLQQEEVSEGDATDDSDELDNGTASESDDDG